MDEAKKKSLLVKIKAAGRTLKEYKNYQQEVASFDLTVVNQDKKKEEFYKESVSALESVKKSLIEFIGQLENFLDENHDAITGENDPAVVAELEKGKQYMEEARSLLPADL